MEPGGRLRFVTLFGIESCLSAEAAKGTLPLGDCTRSSLVQKQSLSVRFGLAFGSTLSFGDLFDLAARRLCRLAGATATIVCKDVSGDESLMNGSKGSGCWIANDVMVMQWTKEKKRQKFIIIVRGSCHVVVRKEGAVPANVVT
jgi:hypothetical protein